MPADKSQPAKVASSDDATPTDSAAADTNTADGDDVVDDAPMNRAERRAKKKAGSKPQVVAKMEPKNVNSGPSPRQWANRRSG